MSLFLNKLKSNLAETLKITIMEKQNIIICNKCNKTFDYSKSIKCMHCGEYQNVEDEDFDNGIMYPAHETWND